MGGFLALKMEVTWSDSERDPARSPARVACQAWGSVRGQAPEEVKAAGSRQKGRGDGGLKLGGRVITPSDLSGTFLVLLWKVQGSRRPLRPQQPWMIDRSTC